MTTNLSDEYVNKHFYYGARDQIKAMMAMNEDDVCDLIGVNLSTSEIKKILNLIAEQVQEKIKRGK